MAKKLYVGNLSYSTTEDQVLQLFSQAGEVVSVNLITDRDTGRPKGFGFVEMETDEGAEAAITRFNGQTFNERTLTVNEARPREERPRSDRPRNFSNSGGGSGSGGSSSGGGRRRESGFRGDRDDNFGGGRRNRF